MAGIILFAGGSLFLSSLHELMDRQASPEVWPIFANWHLPCLECRALTNFAFARPGWNASVDIHIEVDPAISVTEGHGIGHAVKDRLVTEIAAVRDVLVHIEPFHQGLK